MSSNYRLPIKQFEKKTWQENQVYKKNLSKLKFWPFLTIIIIGLVVFSFSRFFTDNNKPIKDITLMATTNINTLKFNECELNHTKDNLNHIWQSNNQNECNYKFLLSDRRNENSIIIDEVSNYYLQTDNKNINIINPQKLLRPILESNNNLFNKDLLQKNKNRLGYDFYGNCTKKNLCTLVRIKDNQITLLKKDILNTTLKAYDIDRLEMIEDQNNLFLQIFSNGVRKRFKFDTNAGPKNLIEIL